MHIKMPRTNTCTHAKKDRETKRCRETNRQKNKKTKRNRDRKCVEISRKMMEEKKEKARRL